MEAADAARQEAADPEGRRLLRRACVSVWRSPCGHSTEGGIYSLTAASSIADGEAQAYRAGSAHRAQQAQAQARAMGAAAAAAQSRAEGAVAEAAAARARVDEAAKADAAKAVETVTAATYGSECPLS